MPTSNPFAISSIITEVMKYKPIETVLDVGIGFGKWGFLCREYLEIWDHKEKGDVVINGIEAYSPYLTPIHEYVYDHIYREDVSQMNLSKIGKHDIVLWVDVIEHMPKEVGMKVLKGLYAITNKALLVNTPSKWHGGHGSNESGDYEMHVSYWEPKDFIVNFPNVKIIDSDSGIEGLQTFTAILPKVQAGTLK